MLGDGPDPADETVDDGLQHSLTHEGAAPAAPNDTNEKGDEKATVVQPSGDPLPGSEDPPSR